MSNINTPKNQYSLCEWNKKIKKKKTIVVSLPSTNSQLGMARAKAEKSVQYDLTGDKTQQQ